MLLDGTVVDEPVEVTTDSSRGQPQPGGEGRCGEWTVLGDRPSNPVPGARLKHVRCGTGSRRAPRNGVVCDKHKTSVT
jgi:hypothetical protein